MIKGNLSDDLSQLKVTQCIEIYTDCDKHILIKKTKKSSFGRSND